MSAIKYNFEMTRGTSGVEHNPVGLVMTFKTSGIEDIFTGGDLVFVTELRNGVRLEKTSANNGITIVGGKITVPFSVADSLVLPEGGSVAYSLEWRKGADQRIKAYGRINVLERANLD